MNVHKLTLVASILFGSIQLSAQGAQSIHPEKVFRDPSHGVTFSYPAQWELSHGMSFYLGTAILQIEPGQEKSLATVGFYGGSGKGYRPYPNTNLSGIQFVYTIRTTPDQASCEATPTNTEVDGKQHETINGTKYLRISGADGGLSHSVTQVIYATYRSGRCFLFEQDIHSVPAHMEDWANPLPKSTDDKLRAQLHAVMLSVHIHDAPPDLPPHPSPVAPKKNQTPSAPLPSKTYMDAQTGLSFRYPKDWSSFDGLYTPALILQNGSPTPDTAKISVGFENQASLPAAYRGLRDTGLAGVQFAYLSLPNISSQSCMERTSITGDETVKNVVINGVTFRQASTSDAALGHQVDRITYAAMSRGTCSLFEAAIHFANTEEASRQITPAEVARLRRELDSVMATVKLTSNQSRRESHPSSLGHDASRPPHSVTASIGKGQQP